MNISDRKVNIVNIANPFEYRSSVVTEAMGGVSIRECYGLSGIDRLNLPYLCFYRGEVMLRCDWDSTKLSSGDVLIFMRVYRGVGGKTAKNIGLALSILGGTFLTLGLAGAGLGLSAGLSTAFTIGGGVGLVGGSIITGLAGGVPEKDPVDKQLEAVKSSKVYSLNPRNQKADFGDPVSVIYGKMRIYPPFIAQPYSQYENNKQILYQIFSIGSGDLVNKIDDNSIKYGDTLVESYRASFYKAYETFNPFRTNVAYTKGLENKEIMDEYNETPYILNNREGRERRLEKIELDFVFPKGWYARASELMSEGQKKELGYEVPIGGFFTKIKGKIPLFLNNILDNMLINFQLYPRDVVKNEIGVGEIGTIILRNKIIPDIADPSVLDKLYESNFVKSPVLGATNLFNPSLVYSRGGLFLISNENKRYKEKFINEIQEIKRIGDNFSNYRLIFLLVFDISERRDGRTGEVIPLSNSIWRPDTPFYKDGVFYTLSTWLDNPKRLYIARDSLGTIDITDPASQAWLGQGVFYWKLEDESQVAKIKEFYEYYAKLKREGDGYTNEAATPYRMTVELPVSVGRYRELLNQFGLSTLQIHLKRRIKKDYVDEDGVLVVNEVRLIGVKLFFNDNIFPKLTVVGVKVEESEELSGNDRTRFNLIVNNESKTRLLEVVKDMTLNSNYGIGLNSDRLRSITQSIRNGDPINNYKVNCIFDSKTTIWEALKLVARVGRSEVLTLGDQLVLKRDHVRAIDPAVYIFSPNNIKKGSFKGIYVAPQGDRGNNLKQGFTFSFFNEDRLFKKEEVNYIYNHISGDLKNIPFDRILVESDRVQPEIESIKTDFFGVTNEQDVRREIKFLAKKKLYNRLAIEFKTGMEGRLIRIYDKFIFEHDLVSTSLLVGEVVRFPLKDNPNILELRSEEPLRESGDLLFALKDGRVSRPIRFTKVKGKDYWVELINARPSVTERGTDGSLWLVTTKEGDIYVGNKYYKTRFNIRYLDKRSREFIALEVIPNSFDDITIKAVEYHPEVYAGEIS